ncbi:hypothetical protein B0H11DRAFT_2139665, partial [Mycena galericulata]
MENEATAAGLRLRPRGETGGAWNLEDLQKHDALECLPLTRLSFKTAKEVTRAPHLGAGRIIVPGQRIHLSVALKSKDYRPRAKFLQDAGIEWDSFIGKDLGTGDFSWALLLENEIEMDLLETLESQSYWIKRLAFMAHSGQLAENYLAKTQAGFTGQQYQRCPCCSQCVPELQELQPGTFDADLATLLEQEAHLLFSQEHKDEALHTYRKAEVIRRKITTTDKARTTDTENLASCLESTPSVSIAKEAVELRRLMHERHKAS